jgi:hypothetical protein
MNIVDKLFSTVQTFGTKIHKKYYHIGILEGVVFWPLIFSVKVKRTKFYSPPITFLESFVRSTDKP